MTNLSEKLGDVGFDGLIADVNPAAVVTSVFVAGGEAEATIKRGAVLTLGENGYAVYDGTDDLTSPVILAEDAAVGTEGADVAVYAMGCFDPAKLITAGDHELSGPDYVALRDVGIILKGVFEYVTEPEG